jgi:hypothetical protein
MYVHVYRNKTVYRDKKGIGIWEWLCLMYFIYTYTKLKHQIITTTSLWLKTIFFSFRMTLGIFANCIFCLKVKYLPRQQKKKLQTDIKENGGKFSFLLNPQVFPNLAVTLWLIGCVQGTVLTAREEAEKTGQETVWEGWSHRDTHPWGEEDQKKQMPEPSPAQPRLLYSGRFVTLSLPCDSDLWVLAIVVNRISEQHHLSEEKSHIVPICKKHTVTGQ